MKSGYKLTKRAMKNLPMERLKLMRARKVNSHNVDNNNNTATAAKRSSERHHSARRMFKLRFGISSSPSHSSYVTAATSTQQKSKHAKQHQGEQTQRKKRNTNDPTSYSESEQESYYSQEEEEEEEEEEEQEPLTDEQIHELVEDKYFDKQYDPARYELSELKVTYSDSEEESKAERAVAELRLLELRQLCEIVSSTLKRRVLARHREFMSGVLRIREMNDALLLTSSESKKTGNSVRKAKQNVMAQLTLLAQSRRNRNVQETLSLMTAMKELCINRTQLYALLANGKLVDAALFINKQSSLERKSNLEQEHKISNSNGVDSSNSNDVLLRLRKVHSLKSLVDEWQAYCTEPMNKLQNSFEFLLTECLTNKFIPSTYRNVIESIPFFFPIDNNNSSNNSITNIKNNKNQLLKETISTMCTLIASLLWRGAVRILTKSLSEVSLVKNEESSLVDLVSGIQPDHLLLGLCQMSAKLIDFVYFFTQLIQLHEEEVRYGSADNNIVYYEYASPVYTSPIHSTSEVTKQTHYNNNNNNNITEEPWKPVITIVEMHTRALQTIRDIGHRIATDLLEKVILIVHNASFTSIDIDRVLHIFVLMSMLAEGIATLHGNDKEEKKMARSSINKIVLRYMAIHFQVNKLKELMVFMSEDD